MNSLYANCSERKDICHKYLNEGRSWEELVELLTKALNNLINQTTGRIMYHVTEMDQSNGA